MPDGEERKAYKYERVSFRYNGKVYSAYGKTQQEAHKKAAKKQLALERGEEGISSNMPVKNWAAEWLETYKKGNVSNQTYLGIQHRMNDIILPSIGNLKLKDVKDTHLQKVINSRTGYSTSHVSKIMNLMKAMFKQARISRLITYDPAEALVMPKTTYIGYRSITPDERKYILKVSETHVSGLWVKTMLYCGLRPGETIALRWKDIDFKKNRINVTAAKESGSNNIKEPKSTAGIRSIPVPDFLMDEFDTKKRDPFDFVFTKQLSDEMHSSASIRSYWKSFKRALDIEMGAKTYRNKISLSVVAPDLVPYCLRHTYGTELQNAGVSINLAKYLMGHSDISTTANIYVHTTDEAINNAAMLVNAYQGQYDVKTDAK